MHLVTPLLSYMINEKLYNKTHFEHCHTILAAAAPVGKSVIERILDKAEKYVFFQEGKIKIAYLLLCVLRNL